MDLKDFEIMAPVGSRESLAAAIQAGADSIYFGIENLNMRARSANTFTIEDLREIAQTCDEHDMKSYLTVNTIIYDQDLALMRTIVDAAKSAGISAVIAADVAVMSYARQIGQEVHLSTQLNISNVEALRFYAQFADVVVLARELNLEQVAEIYRQIQDPFHKFHACKLRFIVISARRISVVPAESLFVSKCSVTVLSVWQCRENAIFLCTR